MSRRRKHKIWVLFPAISGETGNKELSEWVRVTKMNDYFAVNELAEHFRVNPKTIYRRPKKQHPKNFRSLRSNQEDLVNHKNNIDKTDGDNKNFCPPNLTAETQNDYGKRNDGKFPNPKLASITVHENSDNRVSLPPSNIENLHSEQYIQDVKGHYQYQKKE